MDDFIAFLERAFDLTFVQGEYDNLHRDLSGLLVGALKSGADTFSITGTHFIFSKNGSPVREWDFSRWEGLSKQFRVGMQTILRHDEEVRTHIQLIMDSPEAVTYRFVGI